MELFEAHPTNDLTHNEDFWSTAADLALLLLNLPTDLEESISIVASWNVFNRAHPSHRTELLVTPAA